MTKPKCPACGKKKVQVRHMGLKLSKHARTWLVQCYNGECPELPEVWAKRKSFALKLFQGGKKK